jgi:hypothetical protein
MTDNNSQPDNTNPPDAKTKLDDELDAALAKFASAEPRPNLENRILANLRAEQKRAPEQAWWRWPVLIPAASVVIVLALSLVWKSEKTKPALTAHHPSMTVQSSKPTGTNLAANNNDTSDQSQLATPATKRSARHSAPHPQAVVASVPRLSQFPSPRPLSDEEKLLVHYVHDFPEEAVMIANAQAEFEKEMEKPSGDQPAGANLDQPY